MVGFDKGEGTFTDPPNTGFLAGFEGGLKCSFGSVNTNTTRRNRMRNQYITL